MPESAITPDTQQRCCYIKPDGTQCRNRALRGHYYCFPHRREHRRDRGLGVMNFEVPLLDSHSAVQQVATDLARRFSQANGCMEFDFVRLMNGILRIAALTLPRPAQTGENPQPPEETVYETILDPKGVELALPATYPSAEQQLSLPEPPTPSATYLLEEVTKSTLS